MDLKVSNVSFSKNKKSPSFKSLKKVDLRGLTPNGKKVAQELLSTTTFDKLTAIGNIRLLSDFGVIKIKKGNKTLLKFPLGRRISQVDIPDLVKQITKKIRKRIKKSS